MATPSFLDPQWPPGRSERLAGNHQRRACPAVFALGLWLTGHFLTLAVATPLWVSVVFSGSRNITTLSMCFIFYCLRIRNLCKILFFQLLEFLLKREFLRPPIHQIVYSRMSMKGKQWGAVASACPWLLRFDRLGIHVAPFTSAGCLHDLQYLIILVVIQ